ncbi:hypothetical protein DRO54_06925 [Candidatus Bathyarchaeota archaeon]|nr:MAG: hypothetical protein DRO54_06925 [Candidatus Bathyarchaeota archaeon]
MSRREEKKASGFLIAERFFGLITLIVGALTIHYTNTSLGDVAEVGLKIATFVQVFMYAISIGLIALGIFLILAKIS